MMKHRSTYTTAVLSSRLFKLNESLSSSSILLIVVVVFAMISLLFHLLRTVLYLLLFRTLWWNWTKTKTRKENQLPCNITTLLIKKGRRACVLYQFYSCYNFVETKIFTRFFFLFILFSFIQRIHVIICLHECSFVAYLNWNTHISISNRFNVDELPALNAFCILSLCIWNEIAIKCIEANTKRKSIKKKENGKQWRRAQQRRTKAFLNHLILSV